jgi:glyoxylase-like metal-dependent hydrolase (beta-lactamase superfamily II)
MTTSPEKLLPELHIPSGTHTVSISIIDSTSYLSGFPTVNFMDPPVPGFDAMHCRSYCFLIKHQHEGRTNKYDTVLFDLGVRKDWENLPPTLVAGFKDAGFVVDVKKDVAEILSEHGQDLNEIGGLFWSHWHFDHVGNCATLPDSTDLIVGKMSLKACCD